MLAIQLIVLVAWVAIVGASQDGYAVGLAAKQQVKASHTYVLCAEGAEGANDPSCRVMNPGE